MILHTTVEIKIAPSNYKYWRDLGYPVEPLRMRCGVVQKITVDTFHLQDKSNVDMEFWCEGCSKIYITRYSRSFGIGGQYCSDCQRTYHITGYQPGHSTPSKMKGKKNPKLMGEKNPRWNPDKPAYLAYASQVRKYTNEAIKGTHLDVKRSLCGQENGVQMDHIIPIKYGFYNNVPPKVIGHRMNLQLLTWKENRTKGYRTSLSLQELGEAIAYYQDYNLTE